VVSTIRKDENLFETAVFEANFFYMPRRRNQPDLVLRPPPRTRPGTCMPNWRFASSTSIPPVLSRSIANLPRRRLPRIDTKLQSIDN
jgi:hypothetical protein